jgi:hypothetical protein
MEILVGWLFLASLWMIILISWFLFGMRGDEDFLAAIARAVITA